MKNSDYLNYRSNLSEEDISSIWDEFELRFPQLYLDRIRYGEDEDWENQKLTTAPINIIIGERYPNATAVENMNMFSDALKFWGKKFNPNWGRRVK